MSKRRFFQWPALNNPRNGTMHACTYTHHVGLHVQLTACHCALPQNTSRGHCKRSTGRGNVLSMCFVSGALGRICPGTPANPAPQSDLVPGVLLSCDTALSIVRCCCFCCSCCVARAALLGCAVVRCCVVVLCCAGCYVLPSVCYKAEIANKGRINRAQGRGPDVGRGS